MGTRGIRGAITVSRDDREAILEATARLIDEVVARNEVDPEAIVSIVFTATEDLTAAFPAEAARLRGLGDVPLLSAREMDVRGAVPRCVRLLMLVESDRPRSAIRHVYLDGARSLRDDLA
ncbi:MAG: chorismate mutase [Actinobacteria bacterium]|nr:chorismate mutase [Actinomycetota bacterium]